MTVVELGVVRGSWRLVHVLTHKTLIKSETHTAHKQFGTLYIVHTHTCLRAPFDRQSERETVQRFRTYCTMSCLPRRRSDAEITLTGLNCVVSINQTNDMMSLRRELQKFQPKVDEPEPSVTHPLSIVPTSALRGLAGVCWSRSQLSRGKGGLTTGVGTVTHSLSE